MNPCNTNDLLEMASLDVLGLLDADEREAFERAFRAAPPALQAQIRREQLRVSSMDDLLPAVEPPLGLRARVLAALREAVQSAVPARRDVAGRIVPEMAPVRGVNRWWRAAAVGAAAATVVLTFATVQMRYDYDQLVSAERQNNTTDFFFRTFGPRFEQALFNPDSRFVHFVPAAAPAAESDPDGVTKATLVLDSQTKRGQLYLKNIPSTGGRYALVITNEQGEQVEAVLTFSSRGAGAGVEIRDVEKLDLDSVRGLAIIETTSAGVQTLLRTRL